MKTTTKLKGTLALLFFALLSVNVYANNQPGMMVTQDKAETVLTFDLPENDNTFITIFDAEGTTIFSDMISPKSKTIKAFDFAGVDEGTYTMVKSNKYRSIEKTIEFLDQKVSIIEKDHTYRPVFTEDGNILKVSYLNKTRGDISLTLKDSTWIYVDEKAGNDMAYGKTMNVEKLPKGDYTLTLKVDDAEYSYSFSK